MRRDRRFDADHGWSLALAASAHALLVALWWTPPDRRDAAAPDEALQVMWIERPTTPTTPSPRQPDPAPTGTSATRAIRPPPPAPRAGATPAPAAAEASRPLSAVFLEQGAALAREEAGHDFRRNPLLDPPPAIAAPPPERIAMKTPLTPARVVAGIGQLFGGPGYSTDPCPRIRRNIGHLRTAGAQDAALQEELHRHRRFCQ